MGSCDMNAIGDAALHDKFASITNCVHIAWTQTGRQSVKLYIVGTMII